MIRRWLERIGFYEWGWIRPDGVEYDCNLERW